MEVAVPDFQAGLRRIETESEEGTAWGEKILRDGETIWSANHPLDDEGTMPHGMDEFTARPDPRPERLDDAIIPALERYRKAFMTAMKAGEMLKQAEAELAEAKAQLAMEINQGIPEVLQYIQSSDSQQDSWR